MDGSAQHDVAIVGASIAGCTAATLYGRAGARVALIESHSDPEHWKRVCTHFIQPSANEVIARLGIEDVLAAAGESRTAIDIHTRWGWTFPAQPDEPLAHNIRRVKLDPLLRRLASETPGVESMLGWTVTGLVRDGRRVSGVRMRSRDGEERELRARLVVAADGRDSKVGELSGVDARTRRNERFGYYANFSGVRLRRPGAAQMWLLDPDVAYAFPTDDGLTTLATFLTKDRLPAFKEDVESAFLELFRSLPDGPPLEGAERATPFVGKLDMPNAIRPAARPGLAFIGDAALSGDPLWGIGCGFAFQSADWLVQCTAEALAGNGDLDRALARYRRMHRRRLGGHHFLMSDYSTGRRMNPVERLFFSAATRDLEAARHMRKFGDRRIPPSRFMTPAAIARMARVNLRHRLRSGRATAAPAAGYPSAGSQ